LNLQKVVCGNASPTFVTKSEERDFEICGNLVPIPNKKDWYTVSFLEKDYDKYKPSGRYFVSSLYIDDNAGNAASLHGAQANKEGKIPAKYYRVNDQETKIPVIFFEYRNTGIVDDTPPEIQQMEVEHATIHLGQEKGTVLVHATDQGTGIVGTQSVFLNFIPCFKGGKLFSVQTSLMPLGNDWYSASFFEEPSNATDFLAGGVYLLQGLLVQDNAANMTTLTAMTWNGKTWDFHDHYFKQGHDDTYESTNIPAVYVLLLRD
jgi:hypothetical protein